MTALQKSFDKTIFMQGLFGILTARGIKLTVTVKVKRFGPETVIRRKSFLV